MTAVLRDCRFAETPTTVDGAPNVDIDGERLSQRDEAKLYRYYGLTAGMPAGGNGLGRLRRYLVPDLQT